MKASLGIVLVITFEKEITNVRDHDKQSDEELKNSAEGFFFFEFFNH